MRENYLSTQREILKSEVNRVVEYIDHEKARTEDRLKTSIKERVYEAHSLATALYEQYKRRWSLSEIQTLVREALRPIRFNHGRGYYFATNLNGIEELFADQPQMEGRNMLDLQGGNGQFVVRDMINIVLKDGEGFYGYTWSKPSETGKSFPKVAFVKLFEPFHWVIGTGDYLDEVAREIQDEVLYRVENIHFGKDGYIFIGQYDGVSLTKPVKGRNMFDVQDESGVKIVQELIAAAKNGGGFVSYVMPRFEGYKAAPKLSYAMAIPDWQWYVGAGIYVDEIDATIADMKRDRMSAIFANIGKVLGLMLVLMAVSYFSARRFAVRINNSFDHFAKFFSKAARDSAILEPNALDFDEFERLAVSANVMVKARLEAEESLSASEERYRTLVNQAADAVFLSDTEGRIIDVNMKACESLGYTRQELLGKYIYELDDEITSLDLLKRFRAKLKPNESVSMESIHRRKDGSVFPVEIRSGLLQIKGQNYILGLARDITDRKQAEKALRENEFKFRTVADFTYDWEIWRATDGRFIYTSPSSERITGRGPDEFLKDPSLFFKIIHPEDLSRINLYASECSGPERRVDDLEYRIIHADGQVRWVNHTCNPVFDEQDNWLGRRISIRDVTRVKMAEIQQEQLQKQLSQAQKMEAVGTLAGGIAHDFNNLLQAINGYAEIMLFDKTEGEKDFKELNGIINACGRAVVLIRQLLAFSRKAESRRQPVALNHEATQAKQILERTIPKMIDIEMDLEQGLWPIPADPIQLEQIFLNLGSNSADAMPEGGKLIIETKNITLDEKYCSMNLDASPGDYVVLKVTDNGRGMSRETMEHIFEPFYTTKEMGKGTGLGLASVYGIVKSHGGRITCYSELERGTTFTIYFPAQSQTNFTSQATQEPEILLGGSEGILLVDDDAAIREFASDVLTRFGYSVRTAFSGEDGLERYSEDAGKIDLVILDLGMPGMGGQKCLAELVKVNPNVKVIIASGYSMNLQVKAAREIGATEFLAKPYQLKELLKTIRQVLDKK